MAKARIELNTAGIRELLKSRQMETAVHDVTMQLNNKLGSAYETDTKQMPGRVISSVFTTDPDAIRDILKNNTLLKAVSRK